MVGLRGGGFWLPLRELSSNPPALSQTPFTLSPSPGQPRGAGCHCVSSVVAAAGRPGIREPEGGRGAQEERSPVSLTGSPVQGGILPVVWSPASARHVPSRRSIRSAAWGLALSCGAHKETCPSRSQPMVRITAKLQVWLLQEDTAGLGKEIWGVASTGGG